ncbi:MAG: helix-turn-helix domain-containing protein [Chloroflexota bacterium]
MTTLDNKRFRFRPERSDAAANRVLILETADRLFAERGVATVTMADIAQEAGIGKGTLYRRFANKAELCLSLMDDQMAAFQNGMLVNMRDMSTDGVAYLDQLRFYVEELIRFTERHAPPLGEVERSGLLLGNAHPELSHSWHAMTVKGRPPCCGLPGDMGEVSLDPDVGVLCEAILAPLNVDVLRFQREVRRQTIASSAALAT